MSKSNINIVEQKTGNHIRIDIYRVPKKNHSVMVKTQKQFIDIFRKYSCKYQSFQFNDTRVSDGFTSMIDILSANQDEEEVWMESYRDRKHMDDDSFKGYE